MNWLASCVARWLVGILARGSFGGSFGRAFVRLVGRSFFRSFVRSLGRSVIRRQSYHNSLGLRLR